MSNKHEKFAFRLTQILEQLNMGVRLDITELAEKFQVDKRTIQRDLNERLDFLDWLEKGPRYYSVNKTTLGHLTQEDISRFANFCSIQDLLPSIDRRFFQKQLTQSIQVKGVQYENIEKYKREFDLLQEAIEKHVCVEFHYSKVGEQKGKYYSVEPYTLVNKLGVWYLIGIHEGKQKTFCFTQMKAIAKTTKTFEESPDFRESIRHNDSIYIGNQLKEVIIRVSAEAAAYFTRRDLLPNQSLVKELEDGSLLLMSSNVNEREIMPIVQYWIPHLTIISPGELQEKVIEQLKEYLTREIKY